MRRATKACLRWIDCSCVVVDESIFTAAQRPACTAIRLLRASQWLDNAADYLERAGFHLQDTQLSLALAPEEGRGIPQLLSEAVQQWLDAESRLAAARDQLEFLMAEVVDARPVIAARRPAAARWYLRYCPAPPSNRTWVLLLPRRRPGRY